MKKRTKVMSIRVTAKEKQQIMLMAKLCKLSISDYLRILALGYEPTDHHVSNY